MRHAEEIVRLGTSRIPSAQLRPDMDADMDGADMDTGDPGRTAYRVPLHTRGAVPIPPTGPEGPSMIGARRIGFVREFIFLRREIGRGTPKGG